MKLLAKNRNVKHKLSYVIFDSLLLILFFIKCLHFYGITVGNFTVPLAAASALIMGVIYLIIVPFSPKAANITLISLYCASSVILASDLVYFNYTKDLLSFGMINNVDQLGGVTGAIETLIGPEQLLPLWDLPVLFLLGLHTQLFRKIRVCVLSWKVNVISAVSAVLVFLIITASFVVFSEFKLQHLGSEILSYHVNDFAEFVFPSENNTVVDKDQYSSGDTSTYHGVAEGRNVFMIQIEAFQEFVLGEEYKGTEITPFLNSLIKNDSLYFENYYYMVGGANTADAEFAANNSLFPGENYGSYQKYTNNDYHGLPWLLRDNGYKQTTAFHPYFGYYWGREEAYPYQGFMDYISIEDVEHHPGEGSVFDLGPNNKANTDRRLYEDVIDAVVTYEEPFYSFIITLSSHSPYSLALADRYVDADNPAPNLLQLYIQSTAYVDRTLQEFFDALKANGLYENSIFVLYGDHFAISEDDEVLASQIEEFTGENYSIVNRFKVPLIIHVPGLEKAEKIDTVGSHLDITPTLLDLLGIKNDKSIMFGHNLLDSDYEGIVYELKHLEMGSFITKDVFFRYTKGNINSKAYDIAGNEIEVTDEYLKIAEEAIKTINDCHALLDRNEILLK